MKRLIVLAIVLVLGFGFIFTKGIDSNKTYINQRITDINGVVTNIDLSQDKDLLTYRITYLNKDNVTKHAIYMTKLRLKEFDFIEE